MAVNISFKNVPACQFSVFESNRTSSQAYALSTQAPEDGTLKAWQWYPTLTDTEGTGTLSCAIST